MSTTLNLIDRLLTKGRTAHQLGRDHDAQHILKRLAGFQQLPPDINEETQSRLAEIYLQEGRYSKARRHLTALLVQCPNEARYHYMMASAISNDERGDLHRAAEHYRKSLELEPNQVRCLGEFGLVALRIGLVDEGLTSLRRAMELAPTNPEATGRLVEGLRYEGRDDEARDVLRTALFRNSRDARFRKLWNDFQFQLLHEVQRREREGEEFASVNKNEPLLLPFVRPESASLGGKVVRRDAPSALPAPHLPGRVPDKKHA